MKSLILGIAAFSISVFSLSAQNATNVNAHDFALLIKSGEGVILDVRTQGEFSRGHIENATLISTNDRQFPNKVALLQKNKPIYVYCLSGSRSNAVSQYLANNGYSKVFNLSRGLMEWQGSGYALTQSETVVANDKKSYSISEFGNILSENNIVLVDFHAVWCAPCKKMSPVIDQLKTEYKSKAAIQKIDIEANKELQTTYNIQSVPGIVLFKNGKEVWRNAGYTTYEQLKSKLDQYL